MTTASFEELRIGDGIYTARDVSNILNIPYSRITYWFSKYVREKFPAITGHVYNFEQDKGIYVNFNSFLQLYVFNELKKKGHSSNQILEMYEFISSKYKTNYPFASKSILSVGSEIMVEEKEGLFNAKFQLSFKKILNNYIEKIEFNSDGNAIKYFPLGKERTIVVDPTIQFGSPVIKGTRVNADIIVELHANGEELSSIASMYEISIDNVRDAIEFSIAA